MRNKKRVVIVLLFLFLASFLSVQLSYSQISTDGYEIDQGKIDENLMIEQYRLKEINIKNNKPNAVSLTISLQGNISSSAEVSPRTLAIPANEIGTINVTLLANDIGSFNGTLVLSGDINEFIPISLDVDTTGSTISTLLLEVEAIHKKVYVGEPARFRIWIDNPLQNTKYNVTLIYTLSKLKDKSLEINKTFYQESQEITLDTSLTVFKEMDIPDTMGTGEYMLNVTETHLDSASFGADRFFIRKHFWDYKIFGVIPINWVIWILAILTVAFITYYLIRKQLKKKQRYKSEVDYALLPKPGPRSVKIGKIAETNRDAYFDIDQLTIHTLIAGSTGGGKTVSAEVLIEEALLKGVTVFTFDPTAQWSGFLRKNTNKKMFLLYPKFGLKKTDAKAFNGNVHQILNARQIIDIKKYMVPGEIHVFAVNRLDPGDIDVLVANTVREIFHANLPEAKELKLMIIFDEVHRLLPKFGGSGQGFVQIERGAREFRKWGVGLMLISQVLTDFVGETKANINTEVQMRTRDQGDLDRIKNKYGGYMLQSLLKASTGTGMIENPAYNKGNPYFVTFRPLLHEHARLSDEELESYNKYNDVIEDLEFEIEQLEEEKIDVFDLRLELKMALDKVKSGSFNMVDIYLEGLKPRLADNWKKLNKTPKKREIKLVDTTELEKEYQKAKEARAKAEGKDVSELEEPKKQARPQDNLPPLKLASGVTVTKVLELIDAVNVLTDEQLSQHMTAEKNDFADWVKGISKEVAEKLKTAKTQEDVIIALEAIQ